MKKKRITISLYVLLFALIVFLALTLNPLKAANMDNAPYVIVCNTNDIPKGLDKKINAAGGMILSKMPQIGVVITTSDNPDFVNVASKIKGVKWAVRDELVQWVEPIVPNQQEAVKSLSIGDDETFFGIQWALQAIHASEAWDSGATGAGVRVAILDGGIDSNHYDLQSNIDFAASRSFVPGYNFNQETDTFWHGSHVAGIVAAADNGFGTIGVAPYATIIGIKVLDGGSGYFSWLIEGILYAADFADADIINMSLGAVYQRNSWNLAKLNSALGRAMNYAYQAGVTIVASAGNEAIDFDHAGPWVSMPAEAQHVITVSATGPIGFAYGGMDFDRPASYTNYGQSLIDFAAPGGDFVYPGNYWWYDMVISPTYFDGSDYWYSWAAGTSQAAPHVAGVAALIIEKYGYQDVTGYSMKPAHVEAMLRKAADDLGKPGNDDFYGLGRINAYRAVNFK
jgi:subtilisin family serine protease